MVAPGTSRSSNLGNQGTHEDRPSDDPGPEVEFSSPILGTETDPHSGAMSIGLENSPSKNWEPALLVQIRTNQAPAYRSNPLL